MDLVSIYFIRAHCFIFSLTDQLDGVYLQESHAQPEPSIVYKDLSHTGATSVLPPAVASASSGPRITNAFRSFDGSNYNPLHPTLGQAGNSYARKVPSTSSKSLPDPGLIFDTLLRREGFTPHPNGISSLFSAFANLITHDIFHTDGDVTINKASSYLDLSILYGKSENACNDIRRKDGTGKLHNDAFADPRLLGMPPSTCALLVLFNRNHNVSTSHFMLSWTKEILIRLWMLVRRTKYF